ncbi:MAG: hypothetical protein ACR2IE_04360 [Candidatus Sumerlaeaceae bacterium]
MTTNPVVTNLVALKEALQDLETAVQEPRDYEQSVDHVTHAFLPVYELFHGTLTMLLERFDVTAETPQDVVRQSHERGWLKGDLALWLHMANDYERMGKQDCGGAAAQSMSQDIRACTWLMWETYELLMAKFRWQTQVKGKG